MAEGATDAPPAKRLHSNRSRSLSRGPKARAEARPGEGFKDTPQKAKAQKLSDKAQRKMNKMARAGEADRVILTKMPVRPRGLALALRCVALTHARLRVRSCAQKHLFSGKRSNGTNDWR
jgi:nucleolar GTP-binding protein